MLLHAQGEGYAPSHRRPAGACRQYTCHTLTGPFILIMPCFHYDAVFSFGGLGGVTATARHAADRAIEQRTRFGD